MNKERADEIAEVGYELIITESMDERKKILFARSDVIVILPG
jgi:predicted Rossmann-fold nucleotide-binding protein